MSVEKEAEKKILAVARFVDENYTSDLIRKTDVIALLRFTARGVRKGSLEIPQSWLDDQLDRYGVTDNEVESWLKNKQELKLIQ